MGTHGGVAHHVMRPRGRDRCTRSAVRSKLQPRPVQYHAATSLTGPLNTSHAPWPAPHPPASRGLPGPALTALGAAPGGGPTTDWTAAPASRRAARSLPHPSIRPSPSPTTLFFYPHPLPSPTPSYPSSLPRTLYIQQRAHTARSDRSPAEPSREKSEAPEQRYRLPPFPVPYPPPPLSFPLVAGGARDRLLLLPVAGNPR